MKERGGSKSISCSYLVYCLLRTKSLNLREHIKERFGIGVNRHAMNETYCDEVSENQNWVSKEHKNKFEFDAVFWVTKIHHYFYKAWYCRRYKIYNQDKIGSTKI